MKPQTIPNIDMAGCVKVIDDTVSPPRWKRVADLPVASRSRARAVINELGLGGAWLFDQLGNKEYIIG